MKLYHYTSLMHLKSILADGVIDTTESNIRLDGSGPEVVWLTTEDSPHMEHGLSGSIVDKTQVRITVEVPKDWAKRWKRWAKGQGMGEKWMGWLVEAGGGWEAADTWFITTRPIPKKYWTEIAKAVTIN